MQNITLKELAYKLGLSTSTISKALNNSHEISESTKEKVKTLAGKYNYSPNILAKSLKTGKSNTLAVVIPYLSNPFQSQLVEGAQQAAYEHNYKLLFMQTMEKADLEKESLEILRQQNIDGIIITPCANSDYAYLEELNNSIPLVLVDRIDFDIKTYRIGVDNENAAYEATKKLIQNGLKDILILSGKNIGVSKKRLNGYKKALSNAFIEYDDSNVIHVNYDQTRDELIKNLTHLLKRKLKNFDTPIGLLGTTDTLTVSVLGILSNLNVKVPEQVSVIGFANTIEANSMKPSLSTIVQPAKNMGYLGVEKVLYMINNKDRFNIDYETILLDSTIVYRESCI